MVWLELRMACTEIPVSCFEFEIIIWNAFRHFQTNIDTLTARKDGARCLSLREGTVAGTVNKYGSYLGRYWFLIRTVHVLLTCKNYCLSDGAMNE